MYQPDEYGVKVYLLKHPRFLAMKMKGSPLAALLRILIYIYMIPTRTDMTLDLPEPRFSSIFLSDIHGNAKDSNNVRLLYH